MFLRYFEIEVFQVNVRKGYFNDFLLKNIYFYELNFSFLKS